MKKASKILAVFLSCMMIMTGCGLSQQELSEAVTEATSLETTSAVMESDEADTTSETYSVSEERKEENVPLTYTDVVPEFSDLSDENLLKYVEDNIYSGIVDELNSDDYFVEEVSAVYVSKEYLEELEYNSRANIFFGYTLEDVENTFSGERFVFTLGEDGTTIVKPFEDYDDTYEQVIKNVAIGTGVILICVTVSAVTGGAGAPAVSMIFAASSKTAATFALSSGVISGVASGVIKGIETGDFDEAVKAAALDGSEAFKWGAVTGAVAGGVSEAISLHGLTLNGLTMDEAAVIQKESGYPLDVIAQMKSMDEYKVYQDAGLKAQMINGKIALVQDINLDFVSELPNGEMATNLERMVLGYAPIDPATGKTLQLHHIGQKADATLAVLNEAQHQGNAAILNTAGKVSEIDRPGFDGVRREFWKAFAKSVGGV